MPITTHTTVSIAKTLIWSHTRTATDRGGGSSLFDTSLLEHAIACTGINFSCSDSIMLAAARRKGVRRRRPVCARRQATLKPQVKTALPRVATFFGIERCVRFTYNPTAWAAASRSTLARRWPRVRSDGPSRSSRPTVSESEACARAPRRPLRYRRESTRRRSARRAWPEGSRRSARTKDSLCLMLRHHDRSMRRSRSRSASIASDYRKRRGEKLSSSRRRARRRNGARRTRRKTRPMRSKGEPEP